MLLFEFQAYVSTHLVSSYLRRLFNIQTKYKFKKLEEHYSYFWRCSVNYIYSHAIHETHED